jgi:hypothetical protein
MVNRSDMNLTGYIQRNMLTTLIVCVSNPTASGDSSIVSATFVIALRLKKAVQASRHLIEFFTR